MKLGIKISGMQERNFFIIQMLKSMNLIDKRESVVQYNGVTKVTLDNFFRACDSLNDGENTHVLIMQDDLELCDGFLEICSKIIEKYPSAIWTLFNSRIKDSDKKNDTPYIKIVGCGCYGQAIIIPVSILEDMKKWCRENCYTNGVIWEDVAVGEYAKRKDVDVMSTIPSLVQHIGARSSLVGHNFGMVSSVWKGRQKPLSENWDSDLVNKSKYIGTSYNTYAKEKTCDKSE